MRKRLLPAANLNPINTMDLTGPAELPAEGNWLLNSLGNANHSCAKPNLASFQNSSKQQSSKMTPFGLSINSKKFFNKLGSDESKIVNKPSGSNMLDFNPFGGSFPDSNYLNSNQSSGEKNTVNLEVNILNHANTPGTNRNTAAIAAGGINLMPNFSNFEEPTDTYDFNNVSNDMWAGFGGDNNVFGDLTATANNTGSFGVSAFDLNHNVTYLLKFLFNRHRDPRTVRPVV